LLYFRPWLSAKDFSDALADINTIYTDATVIKPIRIGFIAMLIRTVD